MADLYFPPVNDSFYSEIPLFMTFHCADYSTFNSKRSNDAIKAGSNAVHITIPYPKIFTINNDMAYQVGGSLAQEERNLEMFAKESLDLVEERTRIFAQGGSMLLPDHMETFLGPGSRRKYEISFDMVAKTEAQADAAVKIANTFQRKAFPSWNGRNALVWQHPPLWAITVSGSKTDSWDGNALPCVLKNVDINRAPILNTPFITQAGNPLAMNVTLSFFELEPAVEYRDKLVNRAQIFKPK